jgi:ATP-dependent DNA helicase PIF1
LRVVEGQSLFFTGPAGAGKSYLTRRAITALLERYSTSEVCVTAPTGIAARKIGGITLHAFSGTGIHTKLPFETILRKVKADWRAMLRWTKLKVLFIDEGTQHHLFNLL